MIISSIYIIGQYLVLGFVKQKSKEIRTKKEFHLNTMHKAVTIIQYVLAAILIVVIFQMITSSHYNIAMLTVDIGINYIMTFFIMGLLTQRFFSWFRSNRNSVVLAYGLSSAMLAINSGLTLFFVSYILLSKPAEVMPSTVGTSLFINSSSWYAGTLNYAYFISSIISFILTWGATALLLRHYSQRLGKVKYWIVLSIPLAYFLSQFLTLFLNLFDPLLGSDPIFFGIFLTLIFMLSKPAGGILFGVAFWIIARNLRQESVVRDYMIISAYGFVLLFISNQAVLLSATPYPPFGLVTISFMGLSSYLVLVGIYSSAISVAQDEKLRQSIRKSAIKQSKLLESIGSAHMEQELQRRVMRLAKNSSDKMTEDTRVQLSVTEEDMKQYLDTVLNEIKNKKVVESSKS
jgi:hypothetical protein